MRKLTNKHIADINVLMLTLIAEYAEDMRRSVDDADIVIMHTNDIVYNTRVLVEFNAEFNVLKLYKDILIQDTIVREHFSEVLDYITSSNLINADFYA
jgi:hypothetical protein